jgi:hypothetical protein
MADTRRWPLSFRRHREGLEKVFRRERHDRADIWFVLPDGSNLDECLAGALEAIRAQGLPWLDEAHRDRRAPQRQPAAQTEALRRALRHPSTR